MKRVIGIIFCVFILLQTSSCEKDDFCVSNPVTPNLILRLYDANDEDETKEIDSLYVWAEGRDTLLGVSTDSITIPLNTIASNTIYNLLMLDDGEEFLETFTIAYTTEDDYVSRSCGYRVIFNDVTFNQDTANSDTGWISSFTPNTLTTINSQESAHVKIFH